MFIEDFFIKNCKGNRGKIDGRYNSDKLGAEAKFYIDLLMDTYYESELEEE